jgi:hypothetical protein
VPEPANGDGLAGRHHVVVLLRLVLGPGRELQHGEILDGDGRTRAQFGDWDSLTPQLIALLDHTD